MNRIISRLRCMLQNKWAGICIFFQNYWWKCPFSNLYKMRVKLRYLENKEFWRNNEKIFSALDKYFPNDDWHWHGRWVDFVVECIEKAKPEEK